MGRAPGGVERAGRRHPPGDGHHDVCPRSAVGAATQASGAVSAEASSDLVMWITYGLLVYLFARIYDAVAVSRDEAMYENLRAEVAAFSKARGSGRILVVVGALHCNGILRRARDAPFGVS